MTHGSPCGLPWKTLACTTKTVTIYDAIGEHTLALRFAERLRDRTDKAYPSSFYIGAAGPNTIPASSVDPDSDVGNWFSGSRDLEGAFSFLNP